MSLELDIVIETVDNNLSIPLGGEGLQIRGDGVMANGNLYLWEEILFVQITNRGLLRQLKSRKEKEG